MGDSLANCSIPLVEKNMNLRSPFLVKMPPTNGRIAARVGRVSLRLMIGGPLILLLIVLVTAVRQEWLPKAAPWLLLYNIHDHIYLLIKGYTYTLVFPESLIFWGFVSTILILIVVSQLTDRSLIKEPHINLLRFCLYRPSLYPFIIWGSRFLPQLRIEPKLIKLLARREWEKAMLSLSRHEPASAPKQPCRRLVILTRFTLQLSQHFSPHPDATQASLWRLEKWHTAYLIIHAYGNRQKGWFPKQIGNLFQAFTLINSAPAEKRDKIPALKELFTLSELMQEVTLLKELGHIQLLNEPLPDGSPIELMGMLANLVDMRRREIFDKTVFYLERQLGESTQAATAVAFPELVNNEQTLPIANRIALAIALHVTLFTRDPNIALAYVESVEALAFLLDTMPLENNAFLKAMLQEQDTTNDTVAPYIPLDQAYDLLGKLMANQTTNQEQLWQSVWREHDAPLLKQDFELAHAIAASLQQAAGFINEAPDEQQV